MNPRFLILGLFLSAALTAKADGPADNLVDKVRRVPPAGIKLAVADRTELEAGVAALGQEIEVLRGELRSKPGQLALLPDVQIFHKAVDWALRYDEFYKSNETGIARSFLKQGMERAQQLREGNAPWITATGLVVRGYASKIDGSVQPYGLVVPVSFVPGGEPKRLDFWFHGRGEMLTELDFINGRQRSPGEFVPPNAFVLHLYGRYCNGDRFAGETDLFEALEHAKKYYPIDENRMVVRGFSLGGAACWHFATQHSGLWVAAAPGAGFSETADFLKVYQNETLKPAWWEEKLWHMYDAVDYAVNIFNCPLVAYSGEIDGQKQAADMMAKALKAEGIEMVHVIGPNTRHAYHPEAKVEINRRLDAIVARGRDPVPERIRFTTWTLKYNRMLWLTVDGLENHWDRARVEASIDRGENGVRLTTTKVGAVSLEFQPGQCPLDVTRKAVVILDGQKMDAGKVMSDRSWNAHFHKEDGKWISGTATEGSLAKRHGLQGPIDDAFTESFVMVRPSGKALNEKVQQWVESEEAHAVEHWRREFRGDARVKSDEEISDADIAGSNLILWGDPQSNKILAKIATKLPIQWDSAGISVNGKKYAAEHHVPVMIYPNPLNPKKYVVLNSGFTFREYDYLNNARQTSKLPDFAVVDIDSPVTSRFPGGIVTAGFFGEHWELTMSGEGKRPERN